MMFGRVSTIALIIYFDCALTMLSVNAKTRCVLQPTFNNANSMSLFFQVFKETNTCLISEILNNVKQHDSKSDNM